VSSASKQLDLVDKQKRRERLTLFVNWLSIMKLCTCLSARVSSIFLASTATTSAVQPEPYTHTAACTVTTAGSPPPDEFEICLINWHCTKSQSSEVREDRTAATILDSLLPSLRLRPLVYCGDCYNTHQWQHHALCANSNTYGSDDRHDMQLSMQFPDYAYSALW